MAGRRYTRDNRGRFATVGATARGGRLATASGNKRATQTERLAGGSPKGTVGKPKGLKPSAANPAARKPMTKAEYEAAAQKAWGPNWNAKGTKPKQTADQQLDRLGQRSGNLTRSRSGLSKAEAMKASDLGKQTGRAVKVTQNPNGSFNVKVGPAKPAAAAQGDGAVVNISMAGRRGRSLDAEITRNVKAQKASARSADKARNSQFKSEQSRAKKLRSVHVPAIAKAKGISRAQVESALQAQSPSTQIKALKNWVKTNRKNAR